MFRILSIYNILKYNITSKGIILLVCYKNLHKFTKENAKKIENGKWKIKLPLQREGSEGWYDFLI